MGEAEILSPGRNQRAPRIVVGILLFANRERACIEGRRVVEKLRSFEY